MQFALLSFRAFYFLNCLTGTNGGYGSQISNESETFTYDGLNRLASYKTGTTTTTVRYNNIGNITNKSDMGGYYGYSYGVKMHACNSVAGAVKPGPHAVSNIYYSHYCYDANGNMIQDHSGRSLIYSTFDKVIQASKGGHITRFDYGPERSRYRRTDTKNGKTTTTLYLPGVEKVINDDGVIEWKRDIGVGQITLTGANPLSPTNKKTHYFLKDHLGSITHVLEMRANGTIDTSKVQEMAFDPWGARRNTTNWRNDLTASQIASMFNLTNNSFVGSPTTTKGYTGHEMMDEMDIIHMNGRIYDPKLGRFLQADPFIQEPYMTASLNRYSYVWNNPMNATDPSGYFLSGLLGDIFAQIVYRVVPEKFHGLLNSIITIAATVVCGGNPACAAGAAAFTNFHSTLAQTDDFEDALISGATAGATAYVSAYAFQQIGGAFGEAGGFFKKDGIFHILAHGATGGVLEELQGGKFGHGFVSAGITKALTPYIQNTNLDIGGKDLGQAFQAAIIGGTTSKLTGGKFANGAITAAFGNLFNQQGELEAEQSDSDLGDDSSIWERLTHNARSVIAAAGAQIESATTRIEAYLSDLQEGFRGFKARVIANLSTSTSAAAVNASILALDPEIGVGALRVRGRILTDNCVTSGACDAAFDRNQLLDFLGESPPNTTGFNELLGRRYREQYERENQ